MRRVMLGLGLGVGIATCGGVVLAADESPTTAAPTEARQPAASRSGQSGDHGRSGPVFKVAIAPGVAEQALAAVGRSGRALDGRVYVIVTRDATSEPREQVMPLLPPTTPPLFGRDANGLQPGRGVTLRTGDSDVAGYPLASLGDLPDGTYSVQAVMNVYETFHRSDGSVVKMHLPCGDGNIVFRGAGNVYSGVSTVQLGGRGAHPVRLVLDQVIQPAETVPAGGTCQQGNPPESAHVKQVKIRSEHLSRFWGRPIYIAASVLLPRDYDADAARRFPAVYQWGHYPTAYNPVGNPNPFGFREDGVGAFSQWWLADGTPQVIAVNFRHENAFYDTSYAVDSPNVGPYGEAIVNELMAEIDARYRTVGERWARTSMGYSTGGWQALAQQVYYPQTWGGAFAFCPDVVDFRSMYGVTDLYADENLYWKVYEWNRVPRPHFRSPNGSVELTNPDWNAYERVLGTRSRSGQYMDMYNATWGPQAADGYPAEAWDKQTGDIDHAVAEQWRPYDLRDYIERNWADLAPLLAGNLHVYIGDDDGYYLEGAVKRLEASLASLSPPANATIRYQPDTGHCWVAYTNSEIVQLMADFMAAHAPAAPVGSG